ncbi:MAG: CapA family protein [Spirochaetaceae bacterium]|jgi:poly-gamma-glutamate synthesis protein (capsule biosynthesis protein)|nr:CapA family protein [Spirochaetaceae bacterium]
MTGGVTRPRALFVLLALLLCFSCATEREGAGGTTITLLAVGDNLIHKELITAARQPDGSYDFRPFYSELRPLIRKADLAFINQETLIAGERFGYSGYPQFNGPFEIGEALIDAGFDVINHASNHTMDKGGDAVDAVIDFWKGKKAVSVLGIHESEAARERKKVIVNVKGMRIGFLSYTYGLNGIPLPERRPYLVSLIEESVMIREIEELRPLCDFLAVSMHWGNEYDHTPSARQMELAKLLASRNVDLVIGHHPHVLQPLMRFDKADGSPMFCYFSLGNFISAQNETPRMLGGLMLVSVRFNKKTRAQTVQSASLIPLVTHYERGFTNFKVYPLSAYTEEYGAAHSLNRAKNKISPAEFQKILDAIGQ